MNPYLPHQSAIASIPRLQTHDTPTESLCWVTSRRLVNPHDREKKELKCSFQNRLIPVSQGTASEWLWSFVVGWNYDKIMKIFVLAENDTIIGISRISNKNGVGGICKVFSIENQIILTINTIRRRIEGDIMKKNMRIESRRSYMG